MVPASFVGTTEQLLTVCTVVPHLANNVLNAENTGKEAVEPVAAHTPFVTTSLYEAEAVGTVLGATGYSWLQSC